MNSQGMSWFRLYAEFMDDYYVRSMPEVMQLRYVLLLCLKCKGNVTVTDENAAWLLRITPEEAVETKQCLTRILNAEGKQLIDENWEPVNWEKRQYKSDTSRDRVRKYREIHAQKDTDSACNDDVTPCNGDVTPPDTDTDTESETDTEKNSTLPSLSKESSAKSDFRDQDFADWYGAYPRKCKKPDALKAWRQRIREHKLPELQALLAALKNQQQSAQWKDKSYIPYPATYLRGECWNDVLPKDITAPSPKSTRIEAEASYDEQFEEYCRRIENDQNCCT